MDQYLEEAVKLAQEVDENGEWKYGRVVLKKKLPQISEWQIRKILEDRKGSFLKEPDFKPTYPTKRQQKQIEELNTRIVVKIAKPTTLPPKKKTSNLEKWIIASDFHAPYQHERSCEVFYQIVAEEQPDKVILLGDVINLNVFSKYDKDPTGPRWIDDVASAGIILGKIKQAAPNAQLEWRKGNHEDRLKKHLIRHDPVLYPHLTIQNLFLLSENEAAIDSIKLFSFIDKNEEVFDNLKLVLKHGDIVRKYGGRSAGAEVENLWMSVVMGHCHRQGLAMRSSGRSRYMNELPAFGMEVGCMCNLDLDYTAGSTMDWQHGFGVLTIDNTAATSGLDFPTPRIEPTLVRIKNGKALYNGKVYTA